MLNFIFLEKGLGIVLPHILGMIFHEKVLMLYSINWPNFIERLPVLLEILVNILVDINILQLLTSDVINFEINLTFLIKPFFHMTKKSGQKFKYLDKKMSFKVK